MKQRPDPQMLKFYRGRYRRSKRGIKKQMLDDFCATYGYHRKAATRLLRQWALDRYGRPGPGPKRRYDAKTLLEPLKKIWLATDQMCSKKLKAALPEWVDYYEKLYGELAAEIKTQLATISAASIDRLLKPSRIKHPRKGLSGTRPGSLLKHQIPIKTDHWDVTQPGFMEADTVAHCGNSLQGSFAWSLTLTDIFSGWTENRATWNKGSAGVLEQIRHIEEGLPFALQGFDCDNGSEFLNHHLLRYFTERSKVVQFTRSRPYRKNDNAHVEQKNWTSVRQLFGYDRIETESVIVEMNEVYAEWSLYQNHFCPVMKLIEKVKINSKYRKRYDKPKTPYQRLLDCSAISDETKEKLKVIHQSLNPFILKESIEKKLKAIFSYVKVTPNVRQRL